ncbi:MAG: glycosyltransferase [Phycisphaerales bacterium]|nr:glycosyltransferase [Phycisphaerales bacterium]
MNLLVLGEYIRRFPWSPSQWSVQIARALARRGHHVTLACDAIEDPAPLLAPIDHPHSSISLRTRRPDRTLRATHPFAFLRWALSLVRDAGFDSSFSLTPLAPAHVWLPIEPDAGELISSTLRTHPPISAALELAYRPWLPGAIISERRADRAMKQLAGVHARIGASPSRAGAQQGLGWASAWHVPGDQEHAVLRAQTRRALSIPTHRRVVLVSATQNRRPGLELILDALAANSGDRPILLVMGRRAHEVATLAHPRGLSDSTRFAGGTERADALLAAADIVAIPWSSAEPRATGRLLADALRRRRFVVASRSACGSELVSDPALGMSIEPTPGAWRDALAQVWNHAPSLTRRDSPLLAELSMDALAARLESLIPSRGTRQRSSDKGVIARP